jgi:hypothetical protein
MTLAVSPWFHLLYPAWHDSSILRRTNELAYPNLAQHGSHQRLRVPALGRRERGAGRNLGEFITPAVLGNVVGGVIFVAIVNHRQVAADKRATTS